MIRRITTADVATYKAIRLRALRDDPSAFGSTYEESVAYPDQVWHDRVAGAAEGIDACLFLAYDADTCVGMAGAIDDDLGADRQLISMWVVPEYRGTGVAAELVDAVLDWARDEVGATTVGLWVTRGNARAQRFYERMGFVETGDVQPLPSDPCKDEVRMVFGLRAPSASGTPAS